MKKYKWGLILLIGVTILGGGFFLNNQNNDTNTTSNTISQSSNTNMMDDYLKDIQVKGQYTLEMTTNSKKPLDFSFFKAEMDALTNSRMLELDKMILEAPSSKLQEHLLNKDFTNTELVLYYLKRIEKYDKNYNSIITLNPDALKIAKEMDLQDLKEFSNPLYGLPILIKDNISTSDEMPTTAGAKALENNFADKDAIIISKLKEKGAIVLGKTNLSEWSNFMTFNSMNGYSALGGQTHNAFGQFDVGGSSAGSAASASMNFAALTLGTETSGSLIYPSSQNGVIGMKPTWGLWSTDRIIPIAESQDTAGPVVKHVEDAAALIYSLTDNEKYTNKDYRSILQKDALKGKKIGIVSNESVTMSYRGEDAKILAQIKTDLESLGAQVIDIELDKSAFEINVMPVLSYEYKEGIAHYLKTVQNDNIKNLEDIINFNKADLDNRAPFGQDLIVDSQNTTSSKKEIEALIQNNRAKSQNGLNKALKEVDSIISLSNYISGVYASAGYPAINVPAGYRSNGEPIGVTFVANAYDDDIILDFAYAYEQGTKHRVMPKTK